MCNSVGGCSLFLRCGWVGHSAHEQEAAGAVLVDQEQERAIHHEADLGGERHEPHCGYCCSLCALLIHCDCALVIELFRQTKQKNKSEKLRLS